MKAILISEMLESAKDLKPFLKDYNFDLIHYRSPLKAMDNFDEICPDAIIINTIDFPRHWKVLAQHIRWDTPKESVLLILLIDKNFSQQEADKAVNSGIQAMIKFKDSISDILPEIKNVFERYKYTKIKTEKTLTSKFIQFIFTNPKNEIIITGSIKNIQPNNLSFLPDTPANTGNLKENDIIKQASLQINTSKFVLDCIVKANIKMLELEFINMSENDKKEITKVLS